jgi:hypothetical protein
MFSIVPLLITIIRNLPRESLIYPAAKKLYAKTLYHNVVVQPLILVGCFHLLCVVN